MAGYRELLPSPCCPEVDGCLAEGCPGGPGGGVRCIVKIQGLVGGDYDFGVSRCILDRIEPDHDGSIQNSL
jgi:hypothetical protein